MIVLVKTKPMTYIDIMTEETIDEKIVKALRKKINIATEIMGEELKDLDLKKSFVYNFL